jgi:hypothetical protein
MDLLESYLDNHNLQGLKDLLNYNKIKINGLMGKYRAAPLYHFICNITKYHVCVSKNEFDIVKLLIDYNANVNYIWRKKNVLSLLCNSTDASGETLNIIKLLLDNKIDNYNCSLKYPAMKYAIDKNNWKTVRSLLENGIEILPSVISSYKHFFNDKTPFMTKLLLEYLPPKILATVYPQHNNIMPIALCDYGCLNIFRQLVSTPDLLTLNFNKKFNINHTFHFIDPMATPFMLLHNCGLSQKFRGDFTLIEIVILNINAFKDYNCSCGKNNILGDGKDLNNYIEISKMLITLGAIADKNRIEIPSGLLVYINEVKYTINNCLINFLPKVLLNIIMNYYNI